MEVADSEDAIMELVTPADTNPGDPSASLIRAHSNGLVMGWNAAVKMENMEDAMILANAKVRTHMLATFPISFQFTP